MKQFFRYLSLIAYVLTLGGWGMSYFRVFAVSQIQSNGFKLVMINQGSVAFGGSMSSSSMVKSAPPGWSMAIYPPTPRDDKPNPGDVFRFAGFRYSYWGVPANYHLLYIPLWPFLILLFLMNIKLWKNKKTFWWRGTNRQGFEVEFKEPATKELEKT